MDHIHVTPNLKVMSILDRIGFLDYGQGYYGWMIAVHSAPQNSKPIKYKTYFLW